MKTKFLFLLLLFIPFLHFAQDVTVESGVAEDHYERKAYIFEHLDLQNLSPGNLWDFGYMLSGFPKFNGELNAEVVADLNLFGMSYASILSMPMESGQLESPNTAYSEAMQNLSKSAPIPILALGYTYNRLKPDAIDDGILYVDNEQLKESSGNNISPFETISSFMACPMKTSIENDQVDFIIEEDYFFGNSGKSIASVAIDFGNGQGIQNFTPGVAKKVSFSNSGEKILDISYQFTDGTIWSNKAKIDVQIEHLNKDLDGNFNLEYTTSNSGNGTQVDVWIDYNCNQHGLRKPLIFVEGFNPPELGEDQNLNPLSWVSNYTNQVLGNNLSLFDLINNEGYDVIYIDYHDGGAAIQNNAAALIEAIQWINNTKNANDSFEKNVVIGSSMGGLVGKYALRSMELNGLDHDTELFLAMDSPMRGANVPLGVQYAARDIPNITLLAPQVEQGDWWNPFSWGGVSVFNEIKDLVPISGLGEQILNRPAARQMLIAQCGTNVEGGVPSLYNSFMNEFHNLGDLENAREIAVTNGSQNQAGQPYTPHTKYMEADAIGLVNLLGLSAGAYFEIDIWSLPHFPSDEEKIYKGNLVTTILGVIPTALHFKKVKIDNIPGYDTAPGGQYNLAMAPINQFNSTVGGFELFVGVWFPGILFGVAWVDIDEISQDTFCFIPAVSAIDKNGALDINFDISDNLNRVTDGTTHFKNYVGEVSADVDGFQNHEHEIVSLRNAQLMRFEMLSDNFSSNTFFSESYNFGASQRDGIDFLNTQYFRTTNRITHDFTISGNGNSALINNNGRIAFVNDPTNPNNLSNQHFDLHILNTDCPFQGTTVFQATSGGSIEIGDPSIGNTSNVYVGGNAILQATNTATINVHSDSKVHVLDGAEMNATAVSSEIVVHSDGSIDVYDGGILDIADGLLEIRENSYVRIHAGGEFRMNGGTLRIQDNAKLELRHNAIWDYDGGDIFLNGWNAKIDLGGEVELAANQTFTFEGEPGFIGGYINVPANANGFWGGHFILEGSGSKIILQGSNENDLVLNVQGNADFAVDWIETPSSIGLEEFRISKGKVIMNANARVSANNSEYARLSTSRFEGGKVEIFDRNLIHNCAFENSLLKGNLVYQGSHPLRVFNSDFNHTDIIVSSVGLNYSNCVNQSSNLFLKGIFLPSYINGSDFLGDSHIENEFSGTSLDLRNNLFQADDEAWIFNHGGILNVRCNDFHAYHIDARETYLNLSVPERGGYNHFHATNTDNDIVAEYIAFDHMSELKLFDGYNTFERTGFVEIYHHAFPQNNSNISIDGRNNFWRNVHPMLGQFDETPPDQSRFANYTGFPGQQFTLEITDDEANTFTECRAHDGDPQEIKPSRKDMISGKPNGKPTANGSTKNNAAYVFPEINTPYFNGVDLDDAVLESIALMELYNDSTGSNSTAINLFNEIYTWGDSANVDSLSWVYDIVFQNMKSTLEHSMLHDSLNLMDNSSTFDPLVQSYVDVLMMRTDEDINAENYNAQFYLEMDKAQLFNLIGNKEMSWYLLDNLDNCPLDSAEQAYLNDWLYLVEEQLIIIQQGIGASLSDSIEIVIDTTLFTSPAPISNPSFAFGASIIDPNTVSFTNCNLVTWRDLFDSSVDSEYVIYPNPNNGEFSISYERESEHPAILEMYDQVGALIFKTPINNLSGVIEINQSQLPSGVYTYSILEKQQRKTSGKIIIL